MNQTQQPQVTHKVILHATLTANRTSNSNFEKQLLRNRTIPVVVLMMNQKIEQIIAPIVLALQMILTQYHTWTEILLARNHYTPRD